MATMPAVQTAFLKYAETASSYSFDDITVVSGQNLARGTVLGKITASGKYTAWTTGAADGSQTAAGVLLDAVNASAGDAKGVMVARMAAINPAALVYSGTPNDAQKAGALASLKALGIVARTAV